MARGAFAGLSPRPRGDRARHQREHDQPGGDREGAVHAQRDGRGGGRCEVGGGRRGRERRARLRETTGDPLLVRAGRGLVPTPRALALRERVAQVVRDAEAVLRPAERLDLAQLDRTFTLRTRDGFVENYGAALMAPKPARCRRA